MSRLRLVVAEGANLVLESSAGARFQLPVDEAVRAAVAGVPRDRGASGESRLSPREIQERLRAGVSVEDIARAAGTSPEKVARWEPPVLAERAAVVARARSTRFSRPPDGSVSGLLGNLVDARLASAGRTGDWDATRGEDGSWTVTVRHADGTAHWLFTGGSLRALDPLAEALGWIPPAAPPPEGRRKRTAMPSWESILDTAPAPHAFPT